VRFRGEADTIRRAKPARLVENDPNLTCTRVINACRLIHESPCLTLIYRAPVRHLTASIRSHVKVHRFLDALE
jgi:hypothetical protein